MGGIGSLAFWNDEAAFSGGSITAGTLTLDAADDCTWAPPIALWVPGDSATCTAELTLTATGDNIQGEITHTPGSLTVTPGTAQDQFELTTAPGTLPAGVTFDTGTYSFADPGTYVIPVELTLTFPFHTASEQNSSQGATVELDDITFTVMQTAAVGAVTEP